MAHTNTDETKKIPLGSGEVFIIEFTGSIPKDSEFEKDINRLGWIQGGASIEYKETKYEAKDDLGKVSNQRDVYQNQAENVHLKLVVSQTSTTKNTL